jgi:hypothetical protein
MCAPECRGVLYTGVRRQRRRRCLRAVASSRGVRPLSRARSPSRTSPWRRRRLPLLLARTLSVAALATCLVRAAQHRSKTRTISIATQANCNMAEWEPVEVDRADSATMSLMGRLRYDVWKDEGELDMALFPDVTAHATRATGSSVTTPATSSPLDASRSFKLTTLSSSKGTSTRWCGGGAARVWCSATGRGCRLGHCS